MKAEDSLISLESDKATMDVPAPAGGVVKDLKLKLGDKVSEGTLILTLDTRGRRRQAGRPSAGTRRPRRSAPRRPRAAAAAAAPARRSGCSPPHLSPRRPSSAPRRRSTTPHSRARTRRRRCASSRASWASTWRQVKGTGPNGRIQQEDVQSFVKAGA